MSKSRTEVTKLALEDLKRAGVPPLHVCGGVGDEYKACPGREPSGAVDPWGGQGRTLEVGPQDSSVGDVDRELVGQAEIPTGRERLEERIKSLKAKFGPDSLLVKDYEKQLAAMPPKSESTPDRWVGAGSASISPEHQLRPQQQKDPPSSLPKKPDNAE